MPVTFPPFLLYSLGCVLPQCVLKNLQKIFLATLEEVSAPELVQYFQQVAHLLQLPALPALLMVPNPHPHPYKKFTHTHSRVFWFGFATEFQLWARKSASKKKGHLPFVLSSRSYLVLPLGFFLAVHIQVSQALGVEPGFTHLQKNFNDIYVKKKVFLFAAAL